MSKGNIDAPKGGSKLVGQPGFGHASQTKGHSVGAGRPIGGAEHHKGSTFGGAACSIRGADTKLSGGQSIK